MSSDSQFIFKISSNYHFLNMLFMLQITFINRLFQLISWTYAYFSLLIMYIIHSGRKYIINKPMIFNKLPMLKINRKTKIMQGEFYFLPKSRKIIYVFCNYRNREIFTKQQSLQYYIFITITAHYLTYY